jgi:hypothetical protein
MVQKDVFNKIYTYASASDASTCLSFSKSILFPLREFKRKSEYFSNELHFIVMHCLYVTLYMLHMVHGIALFHNDVTSCLHGGQNR